MTASSVTAVAKLRRLRGVVTDESGAKVVAYHSLVGPLIEAVKELDTRLSALERAHASGPSS